MKVAGGQLHRISSAVRWGGCGRGIPPPAGGVTANFAYQEMHFGAFWL